MKSKGRKLAASFLLLLAGWVMELSPLGAQTDPSGHWEGSLTLPGAPLTLRVDLAKSGADWNGTIDIPLQGLRGFKLGAVTVQEGVVSFTTPGLPGNPRFTGKLAADGQSLHGEFLQSGQKFPFSLERRARPSSSTGNGETPAQGVPGRGLTGFWQGSLKPAPVVELRLVLEIALTQGGSLAGSIVSVDQGNVRLPLTSASEQDGLVKLEVKPVKATFEGKLSADGSEIAGEWKSGGTGIPLVFRRLSQAPRFQRPQDPKPPYSYREEQVVVENVSAEVKLAGTLTLPPGLGPHPAVILLSGSGPQDRDETIMGHRPFLVLADHLARAGIAVLRCDDRGVGQSTGNFGQATDQDFVTDAQAALTFLQSRSEINPRQIGFIGHSEGGMIAPQVAVRTGGVAFIVMLAGMGVPLEELLTRQGQDLMRAAGLPEDLIARSATTQREVFQKLREKPESPSLKSDLRELFQQQEKELTEDQRRILGYSEDMIDSQVRMVLTPWLRRMLEFDPRPILNQLKCPVLALNGDRDLQVAAEQNLKSIREALTAGGNPDFQTLSLPGLNHLFQTCSTGAVNEYGLIEETISPTVLNLISEWIQKRF